MSQLAEVSPWWVSRKQVGNGNWERKQTADDSYTALLKQLKLSNGLVTIC